MIIKKNQVTVFSLVTYAQVSKSFYYKFSVSSSCEVDTIKYTGNGNINRIGIFIIDWQKYQTGAQELIFAT